MSDFTKVSWTKDERRRAKAEKRPLFVIGFDTRDSDPTGSYFVYAGVGDQELVDDIIALVKKHAEREKA